MFARAATASMTSTQAVLLALALLALAGLMACSETADVTGVRLTMHYGLNTPNRLRVVGTTLEGRVFGPSLMPEPARPLEPKRESVLLRLPESMAGEVLAISVAGLDKGLEPRVRGTVQTEIVRHKVQNLFVLLTADPECPTGTHLSPEGDCIRAPAVEEASDDAGNVQSGTGADASSDERNDAAADAAADVGEPTPSGADAGQCEEATFHDAGIEIFPPPPPLPAPDAGPEPPSCATPPCRTTLTCSQSDETCEVECSPGASCDISCGGVEKCKPSCAAGSDCEIVCGANSECKDIQCDADARCLLQCSGKECSLRCERGSTRASCPGNVVVCNRECPQDPSEAEDDERD